MAHCCADIYLYTFCEKALYLSMNKSVVQSRDSSLDLAFARAQAIWVAPKTLAATISPFLLAVIMASLLSPPSHLVGGARLDLWGGGVRGTPRWVVAVLEQQCLEPGAGMGQGAAVQQV